MGFPFQLATFWGPRLCEVAIFCPEWLDSMLVGSWEPSASLCLGVASIFLSQTVYPEAVWSPASRRDIQKTQVKQGMLLFQLIFDIIASNLKVVRIVFENSKLDRYCKITSMHGKKKTYGQVLHYFTIPRWHQTSQWNMTQTQEKRSKHISLKFLLRWSCDVYTHLFHFTYSNPPYFWKFKSYIYHKIIYPLHHLFCWPIWILPTQPPSSHLPILSLGLLKWMASFSTVTSTISGKFRAPNLGYFGGPTWCMEGTIGRVCVFLKGNYGKNNKNRICYVFKHNSIDVTVVVLFCLSWVFVRYLGYFDLGGHAPNTNVVSCGF